MDRLYAHLCASDADGWLRAVDTLIAEIHTIDQNATRIWFAFYPLDLHLAIEAAGDEAARKFGLMGHWRLAEQVDSSHRFLYGHRYWPQVKVAIQNYDGPLGALPALITAVAESATRTARVDRDQLLGPVAVGLMTLRQAGVEAFRAAPGHIHLTADARRLSPHQVLRLRARDDWQGLFGFLRGLKKRWTVTFDEADPEAHFTVINGQEVATGAQSDKREYRQRDSRCTPGEGPIPVECRAASCGTCWVGVLGGAEKLSPVSERDEARRMRVFGYSDTSEPTPLLRLACQARAFGAVSLVIPPWNGMYGKATKVAEQKRA
jgi:ferredoxin